MTFRTFRHVNKPLNFKGLSPIQLVSIGVIMLIGFLFVQFKVLVLLLPIGMYGSWIQKRTKNGNPDPLSSYFIGSGTKKKFVDEGIFKLLKKN
jgi:hypothetical protein